MNGRPQWHAGEVRDAAALPRPVGLGKARVGVDQGRCLHAGAPCFASSTNSSGHRCIDGSRAKRKHVLVNRRSPVKSASFAGYRFRPEVILLAVRWYLRYGLSDRDVEELLAERGIEVDHVTIYRWVQKFTPLIIDAAPQCRHSFGDRWFVDETYVKGHCCIKPTRGYLGSLNVSFYSVALSENH